MIVYKYPFPTEPVSRVLEGAWPLGATVLHFDIQQGVPTLWVQCDEKRRDTLLPHRFVLYPTGYELQDPSKLRHVGSAMTPDGSLVLHCYEELIA